VLAWAHNTNARDGAVRGLATLGDPRALELLQPLAAEDASLRNVSEALVRLRALPKRRIGGIDLEPGAPSLSGFGHCESGPLRHDWDFLHRTACVSEREHPTLQLSVPRSVAEAEHGAVVLLSVKRADATSATDVGLRIGHHTLSAIRVDGGWSEYRWHLPAGSLSEGTTRAQLTVAPGTRLKVDHLLLIPTTANESPPAHGG
jgi:hypothetical protein